MTRKELIDKLFNELEKNKDIIKENLIKALDTIYIEAESKYEKISLQIKIEKK